MQQCEQVKKKREKKERSLALLSLSTDSLEVFCLLRVRPEGPKGGWDTKPEDPKEPWTEAVTGTWEKEDSTLVFYRVLEAKGCSTSLPSWDAKCV